MPVRYKNNTIPLGRKQIRFNNGSGGFYDVIPMKIDDTSRNIEGFEVTIPQSVTPDEVLLQNGVPTGSTGSYKFAINIQNGKEYFRNSIGNWQSVGSMDIIASVTPTVSTATVSTSQDTTRISNGTIASAGFSYEGVMLQVSGLASSITPTSGPLLGIGELNNGDFIVCENSNGTFQWKKIDNTDSSSGIDKSEVTATVGQTSFTLPTTPKNKLEMYRNGIRLPDASYSFSGTTVTYVPASNGNANMVAGDRVNFTF